MTASPPQRGQSQLDQRPGDDGVVHPHRQAEVVDGDERVQTVFAQRREHRPVMVDLVEIRQGVEGLEVGQADGPAFIRDVDRCSGVREDPAPLDAHPEGVHAQIVACQLSIAPVGDVGARAVLGHSPPHQAEQPVDRVVHPPVPVRPGVHGRARAALGLESGMRHPPQRKPSGSDRSTPSTGSTVTVMVRGRP